MSQNIWIITLEAITAIAALFGLWYGNRRRNDFKRSLDFVFLQVLIPKKESKEDYERDRDQISEIRRVVGIAEHFFQSLYGIYAPDFEHFIKNNDFLSLEYIASDGEIKFYIGCPQDLKKLVEKQITSFYPEAVVEATEAPKLFSENTFQSTSFVRAEKDFYFPIKTYQKFESSDPINNILNSLSSASDEKGNSAAIQILIRPVANDWQKKSRKLSKQLSSGKSEIVWWNPISILGNLFDMMINGVNESKGSNDGMENDTESQDTIKAIEEKADRNGFRTMIRCVTSSPNKRDARSNMNSILNSFAQYGTPSLNGFITHNSHKYHFKRNLIYNFLFRTFRRTWMWQNKMILTPDEIASLFHFPHIKYNNTPNVKWQNYKIVRPPSNIPKEGVLLGHSLYRGDKIPIYMKNEDRFRHFYVIG